VVASISGIDWQVEVSDERGYIRRVDGMHRGSGLVIEWDRAAFHDGDAQRALDEDGDRRLGLLGLRVVRYRWADVTSDAARVRHEVRQLVAERRPELFVR
jgi:very-short-patch-repair endonuclease